MCVKITTIYLLYIFFFQKHHVAAFLHFYLQKAMKRRDYWAEGCVHLKQICTEITTQFVSFCSFISQTQVHVPIFLCVICVCFYSTMMNKGGCDYKYINLTWLYTTICKTLPKKKKKHKSTGKYVTNNFLHSLTFNICCCKILLLKPVHTDYLNHHALQNIINKR